MEQPAGKLPSFKRKTPGNDSEAQKTRDGPTTETVAEKAPATNEPDGAATVAAHYNKRPKVDLATRHQSKIIALRGLQNWIKSVAIREAVRLAQRQGDSRERLAVFDMACGKGGDLTKWARAPVRAYLGMDIASNSVDEARGRFKTMRPPASFAADFHHADLFGTSAAEWLPPQQGPFDIVSCQFAFHYAFESESHARTAVANVARLLRPGGVFLLTIPNANRIVKRLRASGDSCRFGNSLFSIEADSSSEFPRFGARYVFQLQDAIDSCPEFLVHMPTLRALLYQVGMVPKFQYEFPQFVDMSISDPEHRRLLERMGVVSPQRPEIPPEEWEISCMYLVLAFQRVGTSAPGI